MEGSGTPDKEKKSKYKGDYVVSRAKLEGAHQIINFSDEPLRYLCFSTMVEPDVLVYTGSERIGLFLWADSRQPERKENRTQVPGAMQR